MRIERPKASALGLSLSSARPRQPRRNGRAAVQAEAGFLGPGTEEGSKEAERHPLGETRSCRHYWLREAMTQAPWEGPGESRPTQPQYTGP